MKALSIISAEHRGMWRIYAALDYLAREYQDKHAIIDAESLTRMLDYLETYAGRMHHPKEDEYLFPRLWERDPGSHQQIGVLQEQHRHGAEILAHLKSQLRDVSTGRREAEAGFFEGLAAFVETARGHIRSEETTIIPRAREVLSAEDWAAIDAAFAKNDDPLFGASARAEFDALRARIVALAPEPIGLGASYAEAAPAPKPVGSSRTVLEVSGLTSHYGRIQALHGIELEVGEGQLVALVGANGAGKTTLLRTISGVQPASGGAIHFYGEDITRWRADKRVVAGICQVPEGRQVFGPLSIEDNLRLGAYTRPRDSVAGDMERMYQIFPILKEKRALPAGTLSGGQQQMLAMARALMGRPKLLLLDEPSMGLAPLLVEEIFRVVKSLKAQGSTIFLVEQNAHAALAIADVGYVIETGKITLSGPGPELLENEEVKSAYLGM